MKRRQFLKTTVAATALVSIGGLLGSCTDSSDTGTADTGTTDTGTADTGTVDTAEMDSELGQDTGPLQCGPTTGDVLGPYYTAGTPVGMRIAAVDQAGESLRLSGQIVDADCAALAAATIEVWQADNQGDYFDDKLRGQLTVGVDGRFVFDTIVPGRHLQSSGWRPAHIHVRVAAVGYRTLVTQLYFQGDPYLADQDSCGSCGSDDPARYLVLSAGDSTDSQANILLSLAAA